MTFKNIFKNLTDPKRVVMYIHLVSEAVKHLLLEIGRNLYDGI